MSDENRIADVLERERPAPSPGFRGALGRRLSAAWLPPARPAHLWRWVVGFAALGVLLLLVAAAQI